MFLNFHRSPSFGDTYTRLKDLQERGFLDPRPEAKYIKYVENTDKYYPPIQVMTEEIVSTLLFREGETT